MRCHYVLSMLHLVLVTMCSSVSLTLLNIRVSVLHTVLQYKGSNSLCIADTAVTLFYKVVGIVAERDLWIVGGVHRRAGCDLMKAKAELMNIN